MKDEYLLIEPGGMACTFDPDEKGNIQIAQGPYSLSYLHKFEDVNGTTLVDRLTFRRARPWIDYDF